ncbi:hypothetical protein Efla_007825 [Eimeria flavescens]
MLSSCLQREICQVVAALVTGNAMETCNIMLVLQWKATISIAQVAFAFGAGDAMGVSTVESQVNEPELRYEGRCKVVAALVTGTAMETCTIMLVLQWKATSSIAQVAFAFGAGDSNGCVDCEKVHLEYVWR